MSEAQPAPLGQQILAAVFVAIFGCVGALTLWFLVHTCWQHAQARYWPAVPVQILSWDHVSSTGRTPSTARLVVRYRYQYQGQLYQGSRLDLSWGSDNFSDGRRRRLMAQLRAPAQVVYVNPAQPRESLLDRTLPMPQMAFALVFFLFPCGLGSLFAVSFGLQAVARLTGQATERWTFPLLGIVHGGCAPYILIYGGPDRGPGSTLIVLLFSLLAAYSLYEGALRLVQPQRGRNLGWDAWQHRAGQRPTAVRRFR